MLQKNSLIKDLETILNTAYREDLDIRILKTETQGKKNPLFLKESDNEMYYDENIITHYDLDENDLLKGKNLTILTNIALSQYANTQQALNIHTLDSLVSNLLQEKKIRTAFYLQIIDNKGNVLQKSKEKDLPKTSFLIQPQQLSLNFENTELLELVLVNPQGTIFQRLYLTIISCLLFSFFCIYSIWMLQRIFAKQRKLTAVKNDFFGQISHELKRPLTQIHMAINALSDARIIENEQRRNKYLDISKRGSEDISEKIKMIMALSMEEEGVFRLNDSTFDLMETLLPAVERVEMTAPKPTQIEIENSLSNTTMKADKDHLLQCIMNLIENAIKYSGESVKIIIKIYRQNNNFIIAVKDNGLGIDEKYLSTIFDKYHRVDNPDKKEFGYGIGLNYVKKIIEKHSGNVKVTSELGTGSEFFLCLPDLILVS